MARPTVGWASNVGHLRDVDRAEHRLLAQQLPVVVLVLAAEAFVVIRVVCLRSAGRIENGVVQAPDAASAGSPGPGGILDIGIGVSELDESGTTVRLRREHRVEESEKVAAG